MSLLRAVVAGLLESVRETLPTDSKEGGAFLAGLCWAFGIHWTLLIAITWAHCATKGGC